MKPQRALPILLILSASTLFSSCGPVNFFTRAKKVPREYSVNYSYGNVKSERSEMNKKAWVVYSDREGNVTTMQPGGSLPHTELTYMEPMLVIGSKGDYYKLVKYDPAILKNERLTEYKNAEFYGWIHKDLLLLFNNSETEIRNDIKLKSLTSVANCSVMLEAEKYFANDSLTLYSTPELKEPCGSIGLSSIVYVFKRADNDSKVLVAQKNSIAPDEVEETAIGWVSASLVAPFGQRLVLDTPPQIVSSLKPSDSCTNVHTTVSPVSLSPALYAHRIDTTLVFRTLDAAEIIDHSDNRIYNVDGQPITYKQSKQLSSSLENINVIFAIIPTENVLQQLPLISNAIQNLKPIFDASPNRFSYSYAATIASQPIPFTKSYLTFSDQVIEAGRQLNLTSTASFTSVVQDALTLASAYPKATNIIILIGEKASSSNNIPQNIQDEFIRYNCRLLSYQVYADNQDIYNNFVLQSLNIIEGYADSLLTLKRKLIVYSDQLRTENLFLEGAKNVYALDYPSRSMTQGMVIFPEKGRFTDAQLLIDGLDSLVRQVEGDNINLTKSLDRAFAQVGRHRSRFHQNIASSLQVDPQTRVGQYTGNAFNEVSPLWTTVTDRISVPIDSAHMSNVGLLLTETELKEVKAFIEKLALEKPDKKDELSSGKNKAKARSIRRVRHSLQGVQPDVVPENRLAEESASTDSIPDQYVSTRKVRRHIQKAYLKALKGCVIEGSARHLTLAQAQEYITTMPTLSPLLSSITIKGLTNKKLLTDKELDLLVQYFEEHIKLIEEQTRPVEDLTEAQGEKFFFLPSEAMP